jgi:hypothetical protein
MDRRSFFRALIPAAAVPAVAATAKPGPAPLLEAAMPLCECGGYMELHGRWDVYRGQWRMVDKFWICSRAGCTLEGVPFAPPTVTVQPADPDLVKRVREAENSDPKTWDAYPPVYPIPKGWVWEGRRWINAQAQARS